MKWEINKCPECGEEPSSVLEEVMCQALIQPIEEGSDEFQYSGTTIYDYNEQVPYQTPDKEDVLECDDGHGWATHRLEEEAIVADKVVISVTGGVAEVVSAPDGVEVEIIDHDNQEADAVEQGDGGSGQN